MRLNDNDNDIFAGALTSGFANGNKNSNVGAGAGGLQPPPPHLMAPGDDINVSRTQGKPPTFLLLRPSITSRSRSSRGDQLHCIRSCYLW